jgi:hypothetical protein
MKQQRKDTKYTHPVTVKPLIAKKKQANTIYPPFKIQVCYL